MASSMPLLLAVSPPNSRTAEAADALPQAEGGPGPCESHADQAVSQDYLGADL